MTDLDLSQIKAVALDVDGTPLDFHQNSRTEDMDEAKAAGCNFSSPSAVWGIEKEEAF